MQHGGDTCEEHLGFGRRREHSSARATEFDDDGVGMEMGDEMFDDGGGRVERGGVMRSGDESYEVGFFEVGRVWIVRFVV